MELVKKYHELCQKNNFSHNLAQIQIIESLEKFGNSILTLFSMSAKKSFFKTLLSHFKDTNSEALHFGVYIYGDVGRGKSMLMDLFYANIPVTRKKRIHFHSFMQDTHKTLKQARSDNVPDALLYVADKIAAECQLLCFDEFQVLDITDAMLLGRLFEALINRGVRFVMTSNRMPNDLYLNGLNRQLFLPFIDLLNEKFEVLNLNHQTDYRQEKIKHQDHYLYPLNHQTQLSFEKIWHILTDYNHGDMYRLEHNGRTIKFTKSYKHIVYSDFNNLCDNPLGVGDYLRISETFSVLMLDNIPQLTPDMRNQATRFRNLIDVFYDKGLKIYFRSNVPPKGLYPKGDYNFEFERTLSRIAEMQSEGYGK